MSDIHILTHEFRPKRGGAGVVCEKIAETLFQTGRRVKVWAPEYVTKNDTDYQPGYELSPVKGLKGTRNLTCLWAMSYALIRERRNLKDSILYLGDPGPIEVFFFLNIFYQPFWKELVITLHGSEIERYHKNRLLKWLFLRLLKRTDRVHVLSSYNKKRVLSWFPELESKLIVGYGMMTPAEKLPAITPSSNSSSKIKLLCVGRIHPRKGQLHLLEAVSRLPNKIQQQLVVQFAGQKVKGWYQNKIDQLAENMTAEVKILGGLSDEELEQTYANADIFALTSMPYQASVEGLGLVYLEASRYALPILANRIGGVEDVVIHGQNGYLSSCDNIGELMSNLSSFINNPDLRKQFGNAGRKKIDACKWENVTNQLF